MSRTTPHPLPAHAADGRRRRAASAADMVVRLEAIAPEDRAAARAEIRRELDATWIRWGYVPPDAD